MIERPQHKITLIGEDTHMDIKQRVEEAIEWIKAQTVVAQVLVGLFIFTMLSAIIYIIVYEVHKFTGWLLYLFS